jgi:5'-nucleotidase
MFGFKRVAAVAVLWLLAVLPAFAGGDFALTILHTNDIHAHLAAFDDFGAFCDKEKNAAGKCQGGVARLATAVSRERAKGGPTLLLDAGDQFQGTLYFTKFKGEPSAVFMDRLGYNAMTLGNHEFDDGPTTLANFIRALKFPVVAANVDVSASPDLRGLIVPYIIREIDGRKVGIIGATQPKAAQLSSPGPDIVFPKLAPAITAAVEKLAKQGVDIIIVVSHIGLSGDKKLAASVPGIDIIVGGHSHVLLGNGQPEAVGPSPLVVAGPDGGKTLIVTAGYWGSYLGVLHAAFDAAGRVARYDGNPVRLDASVPEDPATLTELDRFAKPLEAFRATVLGRTETPIGAAMCRREECVGGDLLTEAMLAGGRKQGAVAALANGGGVRAGIAPGDVTLGDVLTAYPFTNTLSVVTLSGADLLAALEYAVSAVGLHEGSGRFLQVAGLRYVYDMGKPVGSRIVSVQIADASGRFSSIHPKADYRIAISDFLARGGDGFTVFSQKGRDVEGDGLALSELVARWITAKSPVKLALDGRIEEKKQ